MGKVEEKRRKEMKLNSRRDGVRMERTMKEGVEMRMIGRETVMIMTIKEDKRMRIYRMPTQTLKNLLDSRPNNPRDPHLGNPHVPLQNVLREAKTSSAPYWVRTPGCPSVSGSAGA